jgi:dolichol-phosphate mannosyltransferase
MSLSIIIPCKNEGEVIKTTVNKLLEHLLSKIKDFEIILINDFSVDDTLNILRTLSSSNSNLKVLDNKFAGLGGAINLAIDNASKKFTTIVMADLSDSPKDVLKYYLEINTKNVDAVFGSRFMPQSKVEGYPLKKLILNRIFNNITKFLFWTNYNDFTNAFKIYKTDVLKKIRPIVSENFNIFLELPLKIISRKFTYSIIPINWQNRKIGKAKFKMKELSSKYLFTLLYCFLEKILLR